MFNMSCAIIACLKQEELYIKEWLDWHISIGVDHFYLCDNNDKDYQPNLSDVIKEYIYIKHFRTKSLEEWCWRYKRGDTLKTKNDKKYPYFLQNFWTFNKRTPEKEKFMKEYRRNN